MHRRSGRGKYAAYITEIAEIYAEQGRNAAATAREIRRRRPELCDLGARRISDWLKNDSYGFAGEVEAAEKRAASERDTEPERWFAEEAARLEARKRQLEACYEEEWEGLNRGRALRLGLEINQVSRLIRDLQKARVLLERIQAKGPAGQSAQWMEWMREMSLPPESGEEGPASCSSDGAAHGPDRGRRSHGMG